MYGVRICSFHDADGEVTVGGVVYRFEFSKMFGPLWIGKTGKVLSNQNPKRAVWEAFYDWYEARYGEMQWRKAEREERETAAKLESGELVRIGNHIFPRSMLP